jgi:hypothetical protein
MRKWNFRSSADQVKHPAFPAKAALSVLLLLLAASPRVHAQAADDARDSASTLKLWGTAGEIRVASSEPSVKVRISLNLVAENTGKESLLLLRRTPSANTAEIVSMANPSASLWKHDGQGDAQSDPSLPKLRKSLDQAEPPEDEVISLGPGDSIGWNVVVQLDIPKSDWDAIHKGCPCGLKTTLDLWPVEPSGEANLARKLAKRWHKKGSLIYAATKQTEPVEIKLP